MLPDSRRRPARRVALLAIAAITAASLAPWAGGTATAAAASSAAPTGVTIFLKPSSEPALAALAQRRGGTRAERLRALAPVLPSAAEHERAVDLLRAQGFTVTDESTWSVTATAPAATIAATFGTRPVLPSRPTLKQRGAASGALPDLPTGLDDIALAAFPTTGGPKVFRPLSTSYSGADLRNAYTSAERTEAGLPALDGAGAKQALTIATIQLSGWNPSDLQAYAESAGLSDTDSTLTQVPVDQDVIPPAPGASSDDDGDVEVDLDQESLLATAPHARQRAYFAPNSEAGLADAFSQVLDDVEADSSAYEGGDAHIAALSVSWGACEAAFGSDAAENVFGPILDSLLAAGVTVFAASGDSGIYDCDDAQNGVDDDEPAVDFPASSPDVVAVGGTELVDQGGSRGAYDGSNWSEIAWSCESVDSCAAADAHGGSGGGASSLFYEPDYQTDNLSASRNAAHKRLVPDIAADASDSPGFAVSTTDPGLVAATGKSVVQLPAGGTSLAAPLSAGLFTNLLMSYGMTYGIGDIHSALYRAAAGATSFRDVTVGQNGPDASDFATPGYDTVTGLGAPLWPAVGTYLFAGDHPTAHASTALPRLHSRAGARTVKVSWSGSPATAAGPALASATVTVQRVGGGTVLHLTGTSTSGSRTFTGAPGATYTMTVTEGQTGNGVVSPTAKSTVRVPFDDRSFKLAKGWTHRTSGGAVDGAFALSRKKGSKATISAVGRTLAVVARTGPTMGLAYVKIGHTISRTLNLHASRPGWRTFVVWDEGSLARHTFTLVAANKKPIGLDALYAYR